MLTEVVFELIERDPDLSHGIAVADGHLAVIGGVEVDGDAIRRADFVLAAVPLADRSGLIVGKRYVPGKLLEDFLGLRSQLLGKREY